MSEQWDKEQSFKIGFLQKCAEMGLTTAETAAFATKLAESLESVNESNDSEKRAEGGWLQKLLPFGAAYDVGKSAIKDYLLPAAFWAPFTIAPMGGAALGMASAKAQDIDDTDIEALKQRELIDFYRAQAERLQGVRRA